MVVLASSQWIVGAKISYNIGKVHYKYYMYVEEATYMAYVVPGVILFYFGLKLFNQTYNLWHVRNFVTENRSEMLKISKIILGIGLVSFFASGYFQIPQLKFIFYLANLLIYIAAAHFMLLFPHRKYTIFGITFLFLFINSLRSGLFHDMIITAVFLVFLLFSEKTTFFYKVVIISLGFSTLYIIQLVKAEYRTIIWESRGNVSTISAFMKVLEEEFAPKDPTVYSVNLNHNKELEEQSQVNTRLNQGWIISKVMDNVPKNQDFLKGETIREAVEAAVLPRFLFPEKKGAEDALQNFRKISGIDIVEGTSMGLSTIGEFYANYGKSGGWLAMFLYGLFLAGFIKLLETVVGSGSPIILLWLLLFFFQVIKAETDLIKIVNHLLKSFLFFIFLQTIISWLGYNLLPTGYRYAK